MKIDKQTDWREHYLCFYFYLGWNGLILAIGIDKYDFEIAIMLYKLQGE